MLCCRVLVLIFVSLATAAVVCANYFPVMRKTTDTTKYEQTLWYKKTIIGVVETKESVTDSRCGQYKLYFQISEGASLGGAGLGLIVMALAIAQLACKGPSGSVKCCASFLISLAFIGCGVCVSFLAYGYLQGYCQGESTAIAAEYAPFKDQEYKFSESMYLICGACALLLISNILQCCA